MRISCGQEPRWYRVNVLDVGREHLGRCIAAAAAVGTLTAVHDAYYSGSPCRTLMIDTVAGEIATVTYSGRGPGSAHLPWASTVLLNQINEGGRLNLSVYPLLSPARPCRPIATRVGSDI